MSILFSKYEATGNDFILIDDRENHFPVDDTALIQRLCHRRFGIGADGVILLQIGMRMRVFNSDGSEASGCGNGFRCLVRFLSDLGLEDSSHYIAVGDRRLHGEIREGVISIEMGEVKRVRSFDLNGMEVHWLDSGVPHLVCFVSDVKKISLETLGPLLRSHPLVMPAGANVNVASRSRVGEKVRVRTYERGVEGETLACGTGAIAVACLGSELFGWESPITIAAQGGDLEVSFDGGLKNVRLTGPAKRVFKGVYSDSSSFPSSRLDSLLTRI